MSKIRIIEGQRVYFYKVIVILQDGRVLTTIDHIGLGDINSAWYTYETRTREKWGGRIETFQCMQMSVHDPEVKKYIRDNGIMLPSSQPEQEMKSIPGNLEFRDGVIRPTKEPGKGGKYRR
jgi:hypothetical protein